MKPALSHDDRQKVTKLFVLGLYAYHARCPDAATQYANWWLTIIERGRILARLVQGAMS
jgi:hypothetical protein